MCSPLPPDAPPPPPLPPASLGGRRVWRRRKASSSTNLLGESPLEHGLHLPHRHPHDPRRLQAGRQLRRRQHQPPPPRRPPPSGRRCSSHVRCLEGRRRRHGRGAVRAHGSAAGLGHCRAAAAVRLLLLLLLLLGLLGRGRVSAALPLHRRNVLRAMRAALCRLRLLQGAREGGQVSQAPLAAACPCPGAADQQGLDTWTSLAGGCGAARSRCPETG